MTHSTTQFPTYTSGTKAPLVVPPRKANFQIRVMSRSQIESCVFRRNCVIISVTSPSKDHARIRSSNCVKDILRLSFHDKEPSTYIPDDMRWKNMFSLDRADLIIDFIEKWAHKVDEVIINCEAGISRSAAIGAAIALRYHGNDQVFYRLRSPNQFVKRLICEAWLERNPCAFDEMDDQKRKPWDRPVSSYNTASSYDYNYHNQAYSTSPSYKQSSGSTTHPSSSKVSPSTTKQPSPKIVDKAIEDTTDISTKLERFRRQRELRNKGNTPPVLSKKTADQIIADANKKAAEFLRGWKGEGI